MRQVNITDGCWLWTGAMNGKNKNRGFMNTAGRRRPKRATHVAWWLTNHTWPQWPHEVICHACDNPKCVRPSHLFNGTLTDNRRDAIAKGRQLGVGPAAAAQIRKLAGKMTQKEIARRFRVNGSTISKIITRKVYADIP